MYVAHLCDPERAEQQKRQDGIRGAGHTPGACEEHAE